MLKVFIHCTTQEFVTPASDLVVTDLFMHLLPGSYDPTLVGCTFFTLKMFLHEIAIATNSESLTHVAKLCSYIPWQKLKIDPSMH